MRGAFKGEDTALQYYDNSKLGAQTVKNQKKNTSRITQSYNAIHQSRKLNKKYPPKKEKKRIQIEN